MPPLARSASMRRRLSGLIASSRPSVPVLTPHLLVPLSCAVTISPSTPLSSGARCSEWISTLAPTERPQGADICGAGSATRWAPVPDEGWSRVGCACEHGQSVGLAGAWALKLISSYFKNLI